LDKMFNLSIFLKTYESILGLSRSKRLGWAKADG